MRTVKYQGAFSRIMGFAGKLFLFSPLLTLPIFFFFCSLFNFRAIIRFETFATNGRRSHYFFYGCAFIFGINELICSLSMH